MPEFTSTVDPAERIEDSFSMQLLTRWSHRSPQEPSRLVDAAIAD